MPPLKKGDLGGFCLLGSYFNSIDPHPLHHIVGATSRCDQMPSQQASRSAEDGCCSYGGSGGRESFRISG